MCITCSWNCILGNNKMQFLYVCRCKVLNKGKWKEQPVFPTVLNIFESLYIFVSQSNFIHVVPKLETLERATPLGRRKYFIARIILKMNSQNDQRIPNDKWHQIIGNPFKKLIYLGHLAQVCTPCIRSLECQSNKMPMARAYIYSKDGRPCLEEPSSSLIRKRISLHFSTNKRK